MHWYKLQLMHFLASLTQSWMLWLQALSQALASFPSVSHTAEDGGHVDWEGADFAILDICDTLRLMRAEPSLLKYLDALVGLRESPFLPRCKQLTRLRLQAELYALTQVRLSALSRQGCPRKQRGNLHTHHQCACGALSLDLCCTQLLLLRLGRQQQVSQCCRRSSRFVFLPQVGGPRYVPRSVNQAAFRVLDALFPMGKLSRRAVSLLFRLWLHPGIDFQQRSAEHSLRMPLMAFDASPESGQNPLRIHEHSTLCCSAARHFDALAKRTSLILAALLRSSKLSETCLILSRRVAASCGDSGEDCGAGVHGVATPAVAQALGGQAESAAPARHLSSAADQWRRRDRAAAAEKALVQSWVKSCPCMLLVSSV